MKLHRAVRFLAFGLLLLVIPAALSSPSSAQIGIGISVRVGPPALPVYEQPLCPGPGHLWTPGYWAWNDDGGYYWVPGTWVVAPVGMLWTPGYWGWGGGLYAWHGGYWGPHVGFYGGINYGFGFGGVGFVGGEWRGGGFFYNSAVTRVNTVNVTNVYVNRSVVVNNESHVAFNGGTGGVAATPTAAETAAAHEPHQAPLAVQTQHETAASKDKSLLASNNHGAPAVAATARPGELSGKNVVPAKAAGAPYKAPAISPKEARASSPATNRTAASNGSKAAANRPSTPANKNSTASSNNRPANNNKPAASTRPATSESHRSEASTPHPAPESHAASAPRSNPKPSKPAPHNNAPHNNAPREEHKRGR